LTLPLCHLTSNKLFGNLYWFCYHQQTVQNLKSLPFATYFKLREVLMLIAD